MPKKTNSKSRSKPKAVVSCENTVSYLRKDQNQKHHLVPFTADEQAKYLEPDPEGETAPDKELRTNSKVVEFGRKKGKRARKRIKKASRKQRKRACRTLCSAPDMVPEPTPVWKLLLLCMLSLVLDLAFPHIPKVPVVWLQSISEIPEPIRVLLKVFHGPDAVKKHGSTLKRPCCLNAHVSPGAVYPSSRMEDYLGGYIKLNGKYKLFWLPLHCTVFAAAPNVPKAVRETAVAYSPLSIPVLCTKPTASERAVIPLDGEAFQSYDPDILKQLKTRAGLIFAELSMFVSWLRQKKGRWKRCMGSVEQFRCRPRNGKYVSANVTEEVALLSTALAVFKDFLQYASLEEHWLAPEKAQEILVNAWTHVLPETAPQGTSNEPELSALNCYTPEAFYQFLGDWFLPTYRNQILQSGKGEAGITALIHQIDAIKYFITPREDFANGYAKWLREKNAAAPWLSEAKPGAVLQRELQASGIPLRGEKNNSSTWRYAFSTNGGESISCFALPVSELPQALQQRLEDLIGSPSGAITAPNPSERRTNHEEGGEVL